MYVGRARYVCKVTPVLVCGILRSSLSIIMLTISCFKCFRNIWFQKGVSGSSELHLHLVELYFALSFNDSL